MCVCTSASSAHDFMAAIFGIACFVLQAEQVNKRLFKKRKEGVQNATLTKDFAKTDEVNFCKPRNGTPKQIGKIHQWDLSAWLGLEKNGHLTTLSNSSNNKKVSQSRNSQPRRLRSSETVNQTGFAVELSNVRARNTNMAA